MPDNSGTAYPISDRGPQSKHPTREPDSSGGSDALTELTFPHGEVSTMLDAMLRSAEQASGKGVRFHHSLDEFDRLTYAELDRGARHEAVRFWRHGLRPGDRVVLAFEAGLDFLRAVYASMYAGLVIVPAPIAVASNVDALRSRIFDIAKDSGSSAIIASKWMLDVLGALSLTPPILTLSVGEKDLARSWSHPGTEGHDIALIQYTSGSTGAPAGVVVSQSNLVATQSTMSATTWFDAEAVVLGWLPHYHDMGLIGLYLQPVFAGYELILTSPSQFLRRPVMWLQLITMYRATTTVAPDFAYNLCAKVIPIEQVDTLDLSSLRVVVTGAEPVRIATLRRFTERFASAGFDPRAFVPAYGMAETTLLVTAKHAADTVTSLVLDVDALHQGRVVENTAGPSVEVVSCGPAARGHRIAIVDVNSLRVAPEQTVGEIWVAGPSVAQGYWENPVKTAEHFGAKLPDDDGEYLRTGDIGFLHRGGLVITGRIKDVIIVRGRNIFPTDVESAVSGAFANHGDAGSAAFEWEEGHVVVVVESRKGFDATDANKVRRDVAAHFSIEPLGLVVVRRGSIPRTSSGKVQRRATRARLANGSLPVLFSTGVTLPANSAPEVDSVVKR